MLHCLWRCGLVLELPVQVCLQQFHIELMILHVLEGGWWLLVLLDSEQKLPSWPLPQWGLGLPGACVGAMLLQHPDSSLGRWGASGSHLCICWVVVVLCCKVLVWQGLLMWIGVGPEGPERPAWHWWWRCVGRASNPAMFVLVAAWWLWLCLYIAVVWVPLASFSNCVCWSL